MEKYIQKIDFFSQENKDEKKTTDNGTKYVFQSAQHKVYAKNLSQQRIFKGTQIALCIINFPLELKKKKI